MNPTSYYGRNHDPDHDHFTVRDVVASYNAGAPTLAPEYEGLPFEKIHAPVLDLLPDAGACVLDMGAGTGRDAAWFAANGYNVVAAEPSAAMRDAGKALHRSPDIRWLDDSLPALEKVLRSKLTFDLIWLSAVWDARADERPRPGVPQAGLGDESRRQHDADPPPGATACRTPDGAGHRRRCGSAGAAARPANGSQRTCSRRLWAGRDRVGGHLAPAPGRWHRRPYAAWIEPAVLNEWIEMMRGYARQPDSRDTHMAALRWLEPGHDTGLVRGLGRRLRESGTRLYCVWTRNRLKSDFDIDHCFPFAAWPCNDLWNLLPSAPAVNRSKGDRLPAAEALERSRSWILEWWDLAYRRDIVLRNQFEDEARSALPAAIFGLEESVTPEDVFEGLMVQQMVLKRDQQLAVWRPSRP